MRDVTTDGETGAAVLIGERRDGCQSGMAYSEPFSVIYDLYASRIYRYLLSRTRDTESAKDLTSQTFLTAFEAYPRYRERGFASAWLFSIARSKYVDHVRQNQRRQRHKIDHPAEVDPAPDFLDQAIASQRIAALTKIIRSLPEQDQELLRLRYVAYLSIKEIAVLLKRKEDTVKKSLYRLVAGLQRRVEAQDG